MSKIDKLMYGLEGLVNSLVQHPFCPSCGSRHTDIVDRKYFHQLHECHKCHLLFRFPSESEGEMFNFYQKRYKQSGLTTDLPDQEALNQLVESNFARTSKDFTRFLNLFDALGVEKGSKILDFGANWGYAVYQLQKAGYTVSGYEISKPRAAFGRKLDISIHTNWSDIAAIAPFDLVYSSHVLEHVPDPAEAIQRQISIIRPGGYLVAVFPHGSPSYREADFTEFHKIWGQVHPVLPSVDFLRHVLDKQSWFMGALSGEGFQSQLHQISQWDGISPLIGDTTRFELLLVYKV